MNQFKISHNSVEVTTFFRPQTVLQKFWLSLAAKPSTSAHTRTGIWSFPSRSTTPWNMQENNWLSWWIILDEEESVCTAGTSSLLSQSSHDKSPLSRGSMLS